MLIQLRLGALGARWQSRSTKPMDEAMGKAAETTVLKILMRQCQQFLTIATTIILVTVALVTPAIYKYSFIGQKLLNEQEPEDGNICVFVIITLLVPIPDEQKKLS